MKSLFSENDIVLPERLGILLEKVDRDTVQELLAEHEEYQTFRAKRKELLNRYPVIETLLEDSGGEYIRAGTSCSIGVFSSQR